MITKTNFLIILFVYFCPTKYCYYVAIYSPISLLTIGIYRYLTDLFHKGESEGDSHVIPRETILCIIW